MTTFGAVPPDGRVISRLCCGRTISVRPSAPCGTHTDCVEESFHSRTLRSRAHVRDKAPIHHKHTAIL